MSGDVPDSFVLPPDKSIFHRLLVIGSLTRAEFAIPLSTLEFPRDVEATIECLQALGVTIGRTSSELHLYGAGIKGWKTPVSSLDCHNSGTTARLLIGALSAQPGVATLTGDASLSRRPMKRLADLLNNYFGADVDVAAGDGLPVTIHGKALHPGNINTPVASAQIKSALLLAALQTRGISTITEPYSTRDHTELMLSAFGVRINKDGNMVRIYAEGDMPLTGLHRYIVPKDISAAYYLIVAAMISQKTITLKNISLNPTRTAFLKLLSDTFKNIRIANQTTEWNEVRGDIAVLPTTIGNYSFDISPEQSSALIDELPLLAVLAAISESKLTIAGAQELRYKESDRIRLIVTNLRNFGVGAEETPDGFIIDGRSGPCPKQVVIEDGGDHRIALAFTLMGRRETDVTISDPSVVNVSFPGYFSEVIKITGRDQLIPS